MHVSVELMSLWERVQDWDGNEKARTRPLSHGRVSTQEALSAGFPLDV